MTPEIRRRLGAKRSQVAHLLHYEMGMRGHTDSSLGRKLGCTPQNVRKTRIGENHSTLVLDALRELGVPEKYLFDPRQVVVSKDGVEKVSFLGKSSFEAE